MSTTRPLTTTSPGTDLPALLADCHDDATVSGEVPAARIEAEALLASAVASGRFTVEDGRAMCLLLDRLGDGDVRRIQLAFAEAVRDGRIVQD